MNFKKMGLLSVAGVLAITAVTGCSGNTKSSEGSSSSGQNQAPGDGVVDIEVWGTNIGYKPITKGSKTYEFLKEKLGVGVISPYVEWGGGTNYLNQLNLKIAANEMPDLFLPYNGGENNLAKNGAIADLTDLLAEICAECMAEHSAGCLGCGQSKRPYRSGQNLLYSYGCGLRKIRRHDSSGLAGQAGLANAEDARGLCESS
ncbi:hypothetical protein LJK87_04970 [Paenibacillus sp. P25]|nr:hypothetical protein LJK87_04970 [Paenibacillus sp. P25]